MADYGKLGLRCGLEIHQQLDTGKLFCSCPSIIRDDEAHFVVKRRLHAVAGESGEVDIAARHQAGKEKYYVYEGYNDTTCLVELDEEPIHPVNMGALRIVMQVALMLGAKLADRLVVMRKTVVDGSNTSGFQRTALVARNGILTTPSGQKIGIPTICIEEESAKIVERQGEFDVYNLSRLGIPLIEIATSPDITHPEQVREAAETIGMILRSTKSIKRGLGTIRQDVNVSIKEGARIEIKGAQELRLLQKLVETEVQRQAALLEIRKELPRQTKLEGEIKDISSLFTKSESKLVKSALEKNGAVLGVKLENFAGLLGKEVQPGNRLGTEFSDYAKAGAGVAGLVHSDELPKYGIGQNEIILVRKSLGCRDKDGFVLVADRADKSRKALEIVVERARQCLKGVPEEVRKANADGTTTFLRPMPGAARMYPETDIQSTALDAKGIEIPKLISEQSTELTSIGLSRDLADQLVRSEMYGYFEEAADRYKKIPLSFIATTLLLTPKDIRKRLKIDASGLGQKEFDEVFSRLDEGKLTREAVTEVLAQLAEGRKPDYKAYSPLSLQEVEAEVNRLLEEHKDRPEKALGIAIGRLKLRASPDDIRKIFEKLKKQ